MSAYLAECVGRRVICDKYLPYNNRILCTLDSRHDVLVNVVGDPEPKAYRVGDAIVMHPGIWAQLRRQLCGSGT